MQDESSTAGTLPSPASVSSPDDMDRIKDLPKEVGVLLLAAGIGGLLLPGPIGSPFLVMAGVVLWPGVFTRVESAFETKFPRTHRQGVRQIKRFLNDLERRYPSRR